MKRRGQSDRLQTRGQPYIGDFAAGVIVFVGAAGRHSQSPLVAVGGVVVVGPGDGSGPAAGPSVCGCGSVGSSVGVRVFIGGVSVVGAAVGASVEGQGAEEVDASGKPVCP